MSNDEIRITTYNIHKGFSVGNRHFLLEQIRHAIRVVDADMVFLQEVVGNDFHYHAEPGHGVSSQFEYLADEVWPHYAYGKNAIYDFGHHGNAILSRIPFVDWKNTDISCSGFSQRGVLVARNERGLYSVCTHFGLLKSERRRQADALMNILAEQVPADAPVLLAGDFNDWRFQVDRELRRVGFEDALRQANGNPARTYPAVWPLLAMDRIYFRNMKLIDAEVLTGRPWSRLSDHCALTAVFAAA